MLSRYKNGKKANIEWWYNIDLTRVISISDVKIKCKWCDQSLSRKSDSLEAAIESPWREIRAWRKRSRAIERRSRAVARKNPLVLARNRSFYITKRRYLRVSWLMSAWQPRVNVVALVVLGFPVEGQKRGDLGSERVSALILIVPAGN